MTDPTDPRLRIDALLHDLRIDAKTVEHPPVHTVEDALPYWAALEGVHTKNLMLKGANGRLWLVCVPIDRRLDLKALALRLGAKKFSFASAQTLDAALGVQQGSVSPLALINDPDNAVSLALDKAMLASARLTFHPLVNTATVSLRTQDFLRVLDALKHPPEIVDFDAESKF